MPPRRPHKSRAAQYPVIDDIYDVVPMPLIHYVPPPPNSTYSTESLRLVRDVTKEPPAFDSFPFTFTLPVMAHTVEIFVDAMKATIAWIAGRHHVHKGHVMTSAQAAIPDPALVNLDSGLLAAHDFTWVYKCPCSGHKRTPKSSGSKDELDGDDSSSAENDVEEIDMTVAPKKKRKSQGSMKVDCPAKFYIRRRVDNNQFEVEWFWKHDFHDPYSLADMKRMRLAKPVASWLSERVLGGMKWPAIRRLLHAPDLFPDNAENVTLVPELLNVSYQTVANAVRKRVTAISHLEKNAFHSLKAWAIKLKEAGWNVNSEVSERAVSFVFFSKWQQQQLQAYGRDIVCLDSTHNTTSNFPKYNDMKLSLFTIVVRSPLTGKGIPVVWFLTSNEQKPTLVKFLSWLRVNFQFGPKTIMTDCCNALKAAIAETWSDCGALRPYHAWCFFHVSRAVRKHALTHAGKVNAEKLHLGFIKIAYSQSPEQAFARFSETFMGSYPGFVNYVRYQWMSNVTYWAYAYSRTDNQGIHTNNYVESWHRNLKENFLPSTSRLRPDDLLHTLSSDVEPEFKKATYSVDWGFSKQVANKAQRVAMATAEAYSWDDLMMLGVRIQAQEGGYLMDSWTNPSLRTYAIVVKEGVGGLKSSLSNCNCKDFSHNTLACKHLYFLSRHLKLKIVEDATSVLRVEWRSGPYGNVSQSVDSALASQSRVAPGSTANAGSWPIGLFGAMDLVTSNGMSLGRPPVAPPPLPDRGVVCRGFQWAGELSEITQDLPSEQEPVLDGAPRFPIDSLVLDSAGPSQFDPIDSTAWSAMNDWDPRSLLPNVTANALGEGRQVCKCTCAVWLNTRVACEHMHALGRELGIPVADSDDGGHPSAQPPAMALAGSVDGGQPSAPPPAIPVADSVDGGQPSSLPPLDLTALVVGPTQGRSERLGLRRSLGNNALSMNTEVASKLFPTLKRLGKMDTPTNRKRFIANLSPADAESILDAVKTLHEVVDTALDSGRPAKQLRF